MQATPTPAYALPCARVLSFDARNVLNGVLAAADHDKEWNERKAYQDVSVCLDTVHVSIPYKVTIENMVIYLRQMVRAGLLIEHGVRYKLSGLLALEYAEWKKNQQNEVAA